LGKAKRDYDMLNVGRLTRVGGSLRTIMAAMNIVTILECLESTIAVQREDTLASHKLYIRLLEGLVSRVVGE